MSYKQLTSHQKRVVFSSSIGNALEFYDFTLCGVFIPILATVFFPKGNELAALLGGIFAFSAAFWTRPLGAILFGNMGDKEGRKKALSLTVMFMGIPTMMIGFLPSFETIGVAAPLILVALRMIQGLCTGGEYNGAAIFALEHAEKKSGFISGLISASCVAGAVLATIMGISLARYGADSIAWRFAFILGGFISIIGFYIRKKTNESLSNDAKPSKRWFPIKSVIQEYKLSFLTGITSMVYAH
jgi:MHS family proline/betaine transporter-like MFS transporter